MVFKKLIAPSILSADFGRLAEEVKAVEKAGADVIHVDVMDGHFVPNITIGPLVVQAVRKVTKLPIDVHLMIENPQNYIEAFAKAGANWISVHVEEGYHLDRTLALIKDCGAKAGVAINPATPLTSLDTLHKVLDFVLLMTVNPGFGGQKFIPYCKDKIKTLRALINEKKYGYFIEIDGGVKASNIGELSECGADVFVAGSAIFESKNYQDTVRQMKTSIGV
jgi:ribulose-phosphate 3-epimerase